MTSTWFERAVRPEHVAEDLRTSVPELASGPEQLEGCRIIRLRAGEEEGTWTATYLLDLVRPDGTRHSLSAHGTLLPPGAEAPATAPSVPFGSDGWSHWLEHSRLLLQTWAGDEMLPGLAAMTEPETARDVLERVLRASGSGRSGATVEAVTTTVASYKPGVRVTMVCDLDYGVPDPPTTWPSAVVAKATPVGDGPALHAVQRALWSSPLSSSERVRVAEPLGYVKELGLSIQTHLDHDRTLKDLLAEAFSGTGEPDPAPALRATAAALAAVHTSGVTHGRPVSLEAELTSTWRKRENLTAVVPWLADHTEGVLQRLQTAAGAAPEETPTASHGSFRTAQVLLMPDARIGIIDFDKLRQAEPAADVGPFLAKLRHTAVNKVGDLPPDPATAAARNERVDDLRAEFLRAYRAHAALAPRRLAVWEGMEYLSLVLGAAKKGLRERAASCAAMLHRHLRDHDL